MKRQAHFILLNFLYLACTLASVQAVTYNGTERVIIGKPWSIRCQGGPDDIFKENFDWRRDGQSIPEFSNFTISIFSYDEANKTSILTSSSATEAHDGKYSCLKSNQMVYHELTVIRDYTPKVMMKNKDLSLKCDIEVNASTPIVWKLDGQVIDKDDKLYNNANTTTLFIEKENTGVFNKTLTCAPANNATNPAQTFKIFPKPIPHLEQHSVAVEGEKFSLHCKSKSKNDTFYPGVKILWKFQNSDINSTRISYQRDNNNIDNAILFIEKSELGDAGDWSCMAAYSKDEFKNSIDIEQATTKLRVKDKLAALWPFLGICAEVFVLCAIILIYEKKRNKSELEESDTDQSPDTKPASNKDSDVRHRK